MGVVIALGIAAVAVAFVAAPFFLLTGRNTEETPKNDDAPDALAELLAEKETIYAAIQELDFDLKSGKLSAEDHQTLRRRYEAQAAAVLRRVDEFQEAAWPNEKAAGAPRERGKA